MLILLFSISGACLGMKCPDREDLREEYKLLSKALLSCTSIYSSNSMHKVSFDCFNIFKAWKRVGKLLYPDKKQK